MNYYDEIKHELLNNEVYKRVKDYSKNRSDLNTYYKVGKLLSEAGKHYGEGIIREYSKRLTGELGKGYTETNLKYFRQFYLFSKRHPVGDQLSWSNCRQLLSLKDENKIDYYIKIAIEKNLSKRELMSRIKSNEYERIPVKARKKIVSGEQTEIFDVIKNPILIENKNNMEIISEKILQNLILENMPSFLEELGTGYAFVKNEYKIKLGDSYNYIDLLLFNIEYNCYVVIELKVTELKKEHIGQIQVYMNYIDNNLKKPYQDKTIGIIICKKDNKYIIEYSSDPRIIAREYELV